MMLIFSKVSLATRGLRFLCVGFGQRTFLLEEHMRQVDKLGRIVIPLVLREKYGLTAGATIEFLESHDGVTVKTAAHFCKLCRSKISADAKFPLCQACIELIKAYDGER